MTQTATPNTPAPASAERPIVLLLEDDHGSSDPLIQLLDHYGYDVRLARTLLESMPLLPLLPKYAVLDLTLPDGGGERILDLIRRRKITAKVAIVTGSRDMERLREAARLKPDMMLTKPLDFFRLLEFLRAA